MTGFIKKEFKVLYQKSSVSDDQNWETLIDFTKIRKDGIPIEEVIACLKLINKHG
jgi:hypothetical protein